MSLGENIRAERKRIGLTQEELADKLCISRQAIQKWESDNGAPSIENLKAISQLFGISIDSLVSDEEAPIQEKKPNEPLKEEPQEKEETPRQKAKYCPKCGAEHYEGAKFCKRCGYYLASDNVSSQTPPVGAAQAESVQPQMLQPQTSQKAKRKKKLKIILPIAVSMAVVTVFCALIPTFISMNKPLTDETGIVYEYNKKGKSYAIKSIGSNTDKEFVVPSEFKGKPVTEIKEHAFEEAEIESLTIASNVTTIEPYAFCRCAQLKTVSIGDGVTTIGLFAFGDCAKLETVSIGGGVEKIENYAFSNCSELNSIAYNGTMDEWYAIPRGNYGFWNALTGDFTVTCTDGTTGKSEEGLDYSFRLDEETDTYRIVYFYFQDSNAYKERVDLKIPVRYRGKPVTKIGDRAFYNSRQLVKVTIPESVTSIGEYAFGYSTVQEVVISEGVTSIGKDAFAHSRIQKIVIPKSVTSIGDFAFKDCYHLVSYPEGERGFYYGGTMEEWKSVHKGTPGQTINVICSDGRVEWKWSD